MGALVDRSEGGEGEGEEKEQYPRTVTEAWPAMGRIERPRNEEASATGREKGEGARCEEGNEIEAVRRKTQGRISPSSIDEEGEFAAIRTPSLNSSKQPTVTSSSSSSTYCNFRMATEDNVAEEEEEEARGQAEAGKEDFLYTLATACCSF